ncbi:MAG: type I-MYXAN CRISPR-associated protein Cas6/Cmx6 [Aquincola sp.]|nr:type I-MYXAN CRISPR-associated protein Cas6/Cmx6 [Aquincola sp.]MDH4287453.1 type I-MYXAN CRISPR-associated protein Cas6/Cmx6 [Aquincola sp.]
MDFASSTVVDVAFPLRGTALPRDHRMLLAQALAEVAPWLADDPRSALLPVKVVHGVGDPALLPARARLLVRAARERAQALRGLSGRRLRLGNDEVVLGDPVVRELLPHATLYAHFVDAAGADEATFLEATAAELKRLDAACHCVCGREQSLRGPGHALHGFSLLLHGLRAAASLRVLEQGLGGHRWMGCGVFVPHKSAAAVGD